MISFEEFKAEYKELIDLQIAVAGADPASRFVLQVSFDTAEDAATDDKNKKYLNAENSFSSDINTTFNIYDSNVGFSVTVKREQGAEICNKHRITIQEILLEKDYTLCRDLKIDGLYLYARIIVPENSYPTYSLGLIGECDPFLRILKKNPNFGTYSMVYESEVHRNTASPAFKPTKISLQRLCGGDHFREIKIQVWDFSKRGTHIIVGEFKTNLNNMLLLNKNSTPVKLLSADGTKNHGTGIIKDLSLLAGPSFLKKVQSGIKINLFTGIDVTGINPYSADLGERLGFITNFTKELVDRIGFMLHEGKLQFFGLNGKCCTENVYTNYVMDMFPISGDAPKNSFNFRQVGGDFFNRIMKNFLFNTEGGEALKVGNFTRFVIDSAEESRLKVGGLYTIAVIYLWTQPKDINQVIKEYIGIRERPIMFWFIYLGTEDQDRIQTVDGRKGYLVDELRNIGVLCKTMSIAVSYKTEPQKAVQRLLTDTAQVFAFFADKN